MEKRFEMRRSRGLALGFYTGGKTVIRYMPITLLGLMLLSSLAACSLKTVGPTAPSGYVFSLQAFPTTIFASTSTGTSSASFSAGGDKVADLIVRVQNRQGDAVDGVPVVFEVEPAWAQDAVVTPARVLTQQGEARAHFQARTVGIVYIRARVEDTTQGVSIAISSTAGSPAGGGAGGGP